MIVLMTGVLMLMIITGKLSYHDNDFCDTIIILSIRALYGMGIVMLYLDIQ